MRIGLTSPSRRGFFALGALLFMLPYVFFVQSHYRASLWAQSIHLSGLQRAVELEPSNADYWHLLGRYQLFVAQDPQKASDDFHSAITLNKNVSRYWMDLATAERVLGKSKEQQQALE